jgi:hypothetical protein
LAGGFYREVTKELTRLGFRFIETNRHEVWGNGSKKLTVPFNLKSRYTANGILKDAGSDKKL